MSARVNMPSGEGAVWFADEDTSGDWWVRLTEWQRLRVERDEAVALLREFAHLGQMSFASWLGQAAEAGQPWAFASVLKHQIDAARAFLARMDNTDEPEQPRASWSMTAEEAAQLPRTVVSDD